MRKKFRIFYIYKVVTHTNTHEYLKYQTCEVQPDGSNIIDIDQIGQQKTWCSISKPALINK